MCIYNNSRKGVSEYAPYDAIHVGAAAHVIPTDLLNQLKINGKMVIPVGPQYGNQYLELITRLPDNISVGSNHNGQVLEHDGKKYTKNTITGVQYVPLTDEKHQRGNW